MQLHNTIQITDSLLLKHREANKKHNLTGFMNRELFRVADTPLSYRQINSLDEDKLLNDNRSDDKGWRRFSFKELVYLKVVNELKQYGFTHEKIRPIWMGFFKSHYISEMAISCVLARVEITLIVDSNGNYSYFDPTHLALSKQAFKDGLPTAYVHIDFNKLVNHALVLMREKPYDALWTTSDEYLSSVLLNITVKERRMLDIIRNNDYQKIRLIKKDGEVSVVHAERSNSDATEHDFVKLLRAKDFQTVSVIKRDGKVVSLKVEETTKL
jgi:hypothetical protein